MRIGTAVMEPIELRRELQIVGGVVGRPAVMAPGARISLPWLIRNCLALSFFMSFAQYAIAIGGPYTALLPPIGVGVCAILVLCGRRRADRVQHILSGGGALFMAMLFSEIVSYTSHDQYSTLYGLLFLGVFFCARLIVQEIGVANIMRAFSIAGFLTVSLILVRGTHSVLHDTSRFNGGVNAHPNLVGFVMAGYFPLLLWRAIEENVTWRRWVWSGLAIAGFILLFFTGSRGSLGAILVAAILLILRGVSAGWLRRFRLSHLRLLLLIALFPLAIAILMENNRIGRFGDYLVTFLSLTSSGRGLNSGLSGRTGIWKIAFHVLTLQNRWLFGFGYRTGEYLVGTIDDGYIELLFNNGLIAGSLILGSMARVFLLVSRYSSLRVNSAWNRFYLMLWALMLIYFFNNISARFLFSFGNPFSLCVLMLAASSRRELVGHSPPTLATLPASSPQKQLAFGRALR